MEPVLCFAALAGLGYGAYRAARGALATCPVPAPTPSREAAAQAAALARQRAVIASQRRLAEAQRRQAMNTQYRTLQIAILQLERAPDFRRCASVAAKSAIVPAVYRQRLFVRFRPQLVAHFARCLASGTTQTSLIESLTSLVMGLGIASFEASYISSEAALRTVRPSTPTPADRVDSLRMDHETRTAAIRQGVGNSPELQEQLLEAEEQRYRHALLDVFDDSPPAGGGLPRV